MCRETPQIISKPSDNICYGYTDAYTASKSGLRIGCSPHSRFRLAGSCMTGLGPSCVPRQGRAG